MKRGRIMGTAFIVGSAALALLCIVLYLGVDRTGPELTFQAVDTVYRPGMDTAALLEGVGAHDDRDGDLTDRIVIERISENREEKNAVVFYAVSDRAGNAARASRMFDAVFEEGADGEEGKDGAEQLLEAGITAELKEETDPDVEEAKKDAGNGEEDGIGEGAEDNADASNSTQGNAGEGMPGAVSTQAPARSPEPENTQRPTPTRTPAEEPEQEETPRQEQIPEPETAPEHPTASAPDDEAGPSSNTQAPVLSLKVSEVEVKAGQGPAWVDLIETLSDDKDGYETLFRNLNVSRYDRNKPGTYQVSVSTEDSDGNRSEAVSLTIVVK